MTVDAPTTYQRIQSAALETFARHGFEASGIRQVAERAGIPTSLLYHYSRSKSQLLRVLVEDGLRRLLEADRRAVELDPDPVTQLAALAAVHVMVHAQNPQMARLLDTELRVLDGPDGDAVLDLRDAIDAVWSRVIESAARAGLVDIDDAAVARLALVRMCNGVATWYRPDGRLAVTDLAVHFGRLVLGACRARSAPELDLAALWGLVTEIHEGMPGANPGPGISPLGGVERRSS